MDELDPFAVLGIARSADEAIVRAAFRLRALEAHPDRAGVTSTRRMQSVTAAHALLTDPRARARWEAGHPVVVVVGTDHGPATQRDPASARPGGPVSGSVSRHRLAGRPWQWAAAILFVVAVLAAGILVGPAATTVAALVLGLAWLADQVPAQAPFWPARDIAAAARATGRGCLGLASVLLVALLRRELP